VNTTDCHGNKLEAGDVVRCLPGSTADALDEPPPAYGTVSAVEPFPSGFTARCRCGRQEFVTLQNRPDLGCCGHVLEKVEPLDDMGEDVTDERRPATV